MSQMPERKVLEKIDLSEPSVLPEDLFDNPAKYDGDIPLWRKTVGLVKQYQSARPTGRQTLVDQFTTPVVKDPGSIPSIFNNLDLIAELKPDAKTQEIEELLVRRIEQLVKNSNLSEWSPQRLEGLIQMGLDSQGKPKTVIEKMQAALFNAPRTVEQAVDLFYNAAWTMVATTDQRVREELFTIFCLEKPWLTANSVSSICFIVGEYSADDLHLGKYYSATDALCRVGTFLDYTTFFHRNQEEKSEKDEEIELICHERIGDLYGKLEKSLQDQMRSTLEHLLRSQYAKNQARGRALMDFTDNGDISTVSMVRYNQRKESIAMIEKNYQVPSAEATRLYFEEAKKSPWPRDVIENPDEPLRQLLNDYFGKLEFKLVWEQDKLRYAAEGYDHVTSSNLKVTEEIEMDIWAKNCQTPEQKMAVIKMVRDHFLSPTKNRPKDEVETQEGDTYQDSVKWFSGQFRALDPEGNIIYAVMTNVGEEEKGVLSSIAEQRRPIIPQEKIGDLIDQVNNIREDLKTRFTRGVGNRGYEISISDPALLNLGYEIIEFRQNKNEINVILVFEDYEYEFTLDSNYRIIPGKDLKKFSSIQDQTWLELLTLSHLKKVMCSGIEEEEVMQELIGGQEQYSIYKRQMVHIVEHLRWYKNSKRKYSQEAFLNCLKSGLPIKNLHTINLMRANIGWGGTAETGFWTYVKGAEIDIDTMAARPVRIAFKNASEDIRKVIPLGEFSQEEIDRVEREILEDLKTL